MQDDVCTSFNANCKHIDEDGQVQIEEANEYEHQVTDVDSN